MSARNLRSRARRFLNPRSGLSLASVNFWRRSSESSRLRVNSLISSSRLSRRRYAETVGLETPASCASSPWVSA